MIVFNQPKLELFSILLSILLMNSPVSGLYHSKSNYRIKSLKTMPKERMPSSKMLSSRLKLSKLNHLTQLNRSLLEESPRKKSKLKSLEIESPEELQSKKINAILCVAKKRVKTISELNNVNESSIRKRSPEE